MELKICPSCGGEYHPKFSHCAKCGTRLLTTQEVSKLKGIKTKICPKCGEKYLAFVSYCSKCVVRLIDIQEQKKQKEAELRKRMDLSAVTGFRKQSVANVMTAITDYMISYNVRIESVRVASLPQYDRDIQIYEPVDDWTVVLWPSSFCFRDFRLVNAVASERNWLVSSIHVYCNDYWEHVCYYGSTELHVFCSRPHFWQTESPEDFQRIMAYKTEPSRLAKAFKVREKNIQSYLVDVDTLTNPQAKACADDEYALSDFLVFTDFWRGLGIRFPTTPQNIAAVLRLESFFNKIPTTNTAC